MPAILRYDNPLSFHLNTYGFVYYGGEDKLWTETKTDVQNFFSQHVAEMHFCYRKDGDHHFHGIESSVIDEIIEWVFAGNNRRKLL
jgi:elongation factor P hydroxylase